MPRPTVFIRGKMSYKSKYGKHKTYIKMLKKWIWFCNECGEYITKDTGCSNPSCPEEINDG